MKQICACAMGKILFAVSIIGLKPISPILISFLAVLSVGTQPAFAAACTPGSNCYCDKVKRGSLNDPNLLLCEDWEAPQLHDDVNLGAPEGGPWYDNAGVAAGFRGGASYWQKKYGAQSQNMSWHNGQPASATVGNTCTFSACGGGEWRADDRWQANIIAGIDILKNGEFDDEVPTIAPPSNASGATSGVFDGNLTYAHRIGAGAGQGITGSKAFLVRPVTTFGVTMAVAYPNNSNASGIWAAQWKPDEWNTRAGGNTGYLDSLFMGHNNVGRNQFDPFNTNMLLCGSGCTSHPTAGAGSLATCNAAVGAAAIAKGVVRCDSVTMNFHPAAADYNQAADWPDGTWGCVRAYITNLGTTNAGIKVWFNNKAIIDISGLDGRTFASWDGYTGVSWNAYANTNNPLVGVVPTTQTTYRYEDNIHVTAGPPVSCAQIGFGSAGPVDTKSPAKPRGLKLL